MTGEDNLERTGRLSNLCGALLEMYRRTEDETALDLAVEFGADAVASCPPRHPERTTYLSNPGGAHQTRYEHARRPEDLRRGLAVLQEALDAPAPDHPGRPPVLGNLGSVCLSGYRHTGDADLLARARRLFAEAAATTPPGDPGLVTQLRNQAAAWHAGRDAPTSAQVRELADRVEAATMAPPSEHADTAFVVGMPADAIGDHETAVRVLDVAVGLLPSLLPREAGRFDQEHRLGEHSGLVGEAVAAHCSVGDLVGAVRVAELGRGVLLGTALDLRSDLTDLEHAHPELGRRLRAVRTVLADEDAPVEHRRRGWAEYDAVLAEIRARPGFERFLLPATWEDIRAALPDGTVVLVNAARRRGDAVVLRRTGDPVHVELPDLTTREVFALGPVLAQAAADRSLTGLLRGPRLVREVLARLWDVAGERIARVLPHGDGPSRVWWIPIGPLGLLPLHAAGHPGRVGMPDLAVSSYSPTLRALARDRPRATTGGRRLAVALPRTPGLPDLPGAAAELPERADVTLVGEAATAANVLAALPHVDRAHFACHAGVDLLSPSNSGLRLHDGPLSVAAISRLDLARAELAYLSACSTAAGTPRHADESLHLASAFQIAGFRHVIGGLWPLRDSVSVTAARAFHDRLDSGDDPATALHHTVRLLRDAHPDKPNLWAPFVHNGP
ncbi:CHAT domain-containing protein [Saccharothrix obliqua]|uniref:CHAT domain-containing protein n=1 Tax=Saccharothrix obliqua TaxID=2861747 RepID=UPI0027E23545|nr:CHAT domain-containing protein [Saccharothrix obliqua]